MSIPVVPPPEEAVARERARARRILLVSATLALVVMGGVVALGLQGARSSGPRARTALAPDPSVGAPLGTPSRLPESPADDGCPVDPDHPPRVVFDLPATGLDFGDVKQGVVLEQEVLIRNEGTGPLCIRRVESGCGCIKAGLVGDQRQIAAGQTGRITVTLDTKGKEGLQKKTIRLYTNAVDLPVQSFQVRAAIVLGMRVAPTFVNFGRVTAGHPAQGLVRFRAPKEEGDWTITGVRGTKQEGAGPVTYEWSVTEVPDPRDRVVDLSIRHPGLPQSGVAFQDSILIATTHAEHKEETVRAYLLVVDPILAVPQRLVLGFVPSANVSRVQLMRGDETVKFQVTGHHFESAQGAPLEEGTSGFKATTGMTKDGDGWAEVTYDGAERPPGPLKAVLVIETDEPRMATVRVECVAQVQQGG